MEQQLKARLIGATVLVVLAVLVIPELLSGRKTAEPPAVEPAVRGKRTYTIDLGGGAPTVASAPMPARVDSAPAAVAGEATVTATEVAAVQMPPPQSLPSAPAPAPAPAPETTSVAPPARQPVAPATGGWAIQVGAFGNATAAQKLVTQLKGEGYESFVSPVARGGRTLHRVRVGPSADRATTDQLAQQLKARGLPVAVVAND